MSTFTYFRTLRRNTVCARRKLTAILYRSLAGLVSFWSVTSMNALLCGAARSVPKDYGLSAEHRTAPVSTPIPYLRWAVLGLILLVGLATRLCNVNQPPTDYHCWRQTQTLMTAKSFHERDMNLFKPRVYFRNTVTEPMETEGIAGGSELELTPWLTAWLYKVFGTSYWVDRVVPITFSLLGLVFFFLLVERFSGLVGAAGGTALLALSPMYLFFGRVQMPESFALAISFMTLYWFEDWLRHNRTRSYALALVCCMLTPLAKPTFALIALPMFFLVLLRFGWRFIFEWRLYAFALGVVAVVAPFLWYSFNTLVEASGLVFYVPGILGRSVLTSAEFYEKMSDSIVFRAVGWPLLLLALPALVWPGSRRGFLPHVWILAVFTYFALVAGGNLMNDYYQIVLAPPVAMLAGMGLHRWLSCGYRPALAAVLVVAANIQCLLLAEPMYTDPVGKNYRAAGVWVRDHTEPDARVLSASPNPATLYFTDRTGWTCWMEAEGNIPFNRETIARTSELGASVLVVPDGDKLDDAYFPIYRDIRGHLYDSYWCKRDDNYAVFFLDKPADLSVPEDGHITFGTFESRKYLRGLWGRNYYAELQDATYTDMRYEKRGGLRLDLPARLKTIRLRLSSPVGGNTVSFALNGNPLGSLDFPKAWAQADAVLDVSFLEIAAGRHTLSFEVTKQQDNLIGLLLWSLDIEGGD